MLLDTPSNPWLSPAFAVRTHSFDRIKFKRDRFLIECWANSEQQLQRKLAFDLIGSGSLFFKFERFYSTTIPLNAFPLRFVIEHTTQFHDEQ